MKFKTLTHITISAILLLGATSAGSAQVQIKRLKVPPRKKLPPYRPQIEIKYITHGKCPPTQRERLFFHYGLHHMSYILGRYFKHRDWSKKTIQAHFFCQRQDYLDYCKQTLDKDCSKMGGHFQYRDDRGLPHFYVYRKNKDAQKYGNVHIGFMHEAMHALLASLGGFGLKFWFNEGMAGYFGNGLPGKTQFTVHPMAVRREQKIKNWLQTQQVPRLSEYFQLPEAAAWEHADSREIGESLVYMLMESPRGRGILAHLMEAIYLNFDVSKELIRVYPGGIQGLQRDWEAWLQKKHEPYIWKNLKTFAPVSAGY